MANLFGALGKKAQDFVYNTFYGDQEQKAQQTQNAYNQVAQAHAQMKAGQINPVQYKRQAAIAANSIAPAYSAPAPQQQGYAPQAPNKPQIQAPRISDIQRPRLTTPLPVPNRNILQQAGSLVNRGRDIITPGDQSFTWKAPEEIINEKLAQDKLKNDTFQAITQSDIYKRNQPQIKEALNKGKSFEEISDQTGLGVGDIRAVVDVTRPNYGVKKTNFIGQIVDGGKAFGKGIYDAATVIPKTVTNTAATLTDSHKQALASLEGAYKRGEITSTRYQEQLQNLMDGVIGRKVVSDDNGVRVENQNTFEFTRDFTNDGVDTASVVVPYVKGANVALNGYKLFAAGAKGTIPQLTTQGRNLLKEANAWNTISNAQSALNGQLSPETILQNAAMNYGMPLAGYGVTKGGQRVKTAIDQAAQAPHIRTLQSPEIQQINAHGEQLFAQKQALIDRGLSPTSPAVKQMDNAIRKLGKEYNKTYKRVYEQTKQEMLEPLIKANEFTRNHLIPGGTLGGPLAAGYRDAKKQGLVFEGVDGKPRFEVDDSGAKLTDIGKAGFQRARLDQVIDHPELFKQYPEIANTSVTFKHGLEGTNTAGQFDDTINEIALHPKLMGNEEKTRSTLLHELQHRIQKEEGFARGGSGKSSTDGQYKNQAGEAEARAVQARMNMPMSERYVKPDVSKAPKEIQGKTLYRGIDDREWQALQNGEVSRNGNRPGEAFIATDKDLADMAVENHTRHGKSAYMVEYKPGTENKVTRGGSLGGIQNPNNPLDGEYLGKNLGIDDIARVTDANGNVVYESPTNARSTFYDSLDVPKEDLIIRNDGGKAMSIDDPTAALKQEALKYKSADEFVQHYEKNSNNIPQTPEYNAFVKKIDAVRKELDEVQSRLSSTDKMSVNDYNRNNALGKEYRQLLDNAPHSEIRTRAGTKYLREDLTNLYNKANADKGAMSIEPKNLDSMRQQVRDLWAAGKRDEAKKLSDEITTLMGVEYKKNYPKRGKDEAFLNSVGENGYPEKVNIGELRQQKNGVYAEDRYPNEVYQQLPNFIAKNDIPGTSIKSGDKVGLAGKEDGLLEAVLMPGKEYQLDGFTVSRVPNMSIKDFRRITDGSKPTLQDALAGKSTKIVDDAQKKIVPQVQQSNTPVPRQSKSGQKLRNSQETLSRSSQQSGQKTPSPDSKARTGQTYTDNTPLAPYSKESLNRIQRALNPNDKLAYKNLTPVEKRLYQGEKAKQRVAKLEAKEQARLEKQAKVQQRQDTIDNAPEIDTKSYVKNMSKLQKESMKGDNGVRAKAADFKEKFIDDLAPIEDRLNKAIKNGTSIDPKDHITYQLDRSRRSEGITHAYIRDNGLDKIIQNVDNTKEFDQYLIARHAKELDPEITTGRDLAKDSALVRQLDGKYGEAAKQLYAYNQKLLDTSVDYGLISKEMATKLKKQYPEYVPFNRIFNEDELANLYGGAGKGNASLSKQSAIQKIKGSKRAIASPLNSIIDKTRVVVEQGERNKAAEMLASYKDLPGNPFNLKEIPSTETIGSRSTISFLDKGKKRVFETDKEIADAAKNMTRQDIGLWGRIAAIPARVLRGGATSANVGFAGANVVKDIIGAAINSRHPFYITDPDAFGKALAAALNHKGKYYQELMREGVAGTSFDMYRNPNKSSVGEVRSHKNLATRTAYNVTHPSQWYRTFEDTIGRSEDFGRALQYYSNKKGFEDKLGVGNKNATILAADQARSNSTNFFRHGSYGKGINLAIPYWNAGVQGARIGVNRIKDRPVQTLTKIGFVIAAPSAMIAMNNYGNDKNRQVMEDIPQYEKDGNIIIVGPDARKNEKTGKWEGVTKIPVPPQHIGIHKTIQDAVRASMTGEAFDLVGNLGRITEDYTTVNPTDVKAVASKYTPQGLKLVAEPLSNTNFFTGNKIVPDSQKNLPAADQYNDYTSGTAKTLGKLTNISPRQIDNAIRTGMGGAGQNLVYGVDNALAATGVIDKKDVKGENPINSITRRFSGAASISPSEKADKEFSKYRQEVMNSEEYKNASQYDKSRMLNRLQSDLEAVAYDKSGKSESKLSSKQQSLKDNGFDKSIYTNLDSKVKNTKDTGWTDEYNAAKSAYDKESSSWNPVEKEKKTKELRTLDVKRHYSKEATSLYDMNETDIYRFLDRQDEKKAQSYYKQIVEYGDKMVEAGLWSTNKLRDKYGNLQYQRGYVAANGKLAKGGSKSSGRATGGRKASTGRKPSGGSGGRSGGDVTSGKALLALQTGLNKIKTPRTTGKTPMPKSSVPVPPSFNKKNLRKFAVKSATLSAKKARA